jgi:hypothetical protein
MLEFEIKKKNEINEIDIWRTKKYNKEVIKYNSQTQFNIKW